MKLWAISDLHCNRPQTWKWLQTMPYFKKDWLICAGDICDGWAEDRFESCLNLLKHHFSRVIWTPGNHELYTLNNTTDKHKALRGEYKYQRLLQICHNLDVETPEDPFLRWKGKRLRPDQTFVSPSSSSFFKKDKADESSDYEDIPLYICPIFTYYDYTFKPDYIEDEDALQWALDSGIHCTDEIALFNDPYDSRPEWCNARVEYTSSKLNRITESGAHTILASHFPLRYDTVICPYVPNFSVWCGTRQTEDWHLRYNAEAVVYGHTHNRGTISIDNVQFHEVSLGYPNQYQEINKFNYYMVQVLPHRTSIEGCHIM